MVSRVRCLARYTTWWALLLSALAVDGVCHWVGGSGWVQLGRRYGLLFIGSSDCSDLQPVAFIGLIGSFLECLAHPDEFSQGINACL